MRDMKHCPLSTQQQIINCLNENHNGEESPTVRKTTQLPILHEAVLIIIYV